MQNHGNYKNKVCLRQINFRFHDLKFFNHNSFCWKFPKNKNVLNFQPRKLFFLIFGLKSNYRGDIVVKLTQNEKKFSWCIVKEKKNLRFCGFFSVFNRCISFNNLEANFLNFNLCYTSFFGFMRDVLQDLGQICYTYYID